MTTVEKVSPEIDFSHKVGNHSSPLYIKLNPINNVQTFNTSLTSVYGPVEILVPAKVLSLKKSKLSWDITIPAQGAANYAWIQANALCQLDRVVITSQNTNQILLDLPNLNRYASMFSPVATTMEELNNKASPGYSTTLTTVPQTSATQAAAQAIPYEDISRNFQSTNVDGNATDYGCPGAGIRKLLINTATNTAAALAFELDLGSLQGTICDVDQLLYFSGEQLLISLYFSAVNRFAFLGTSATIPTTGVGAAVGQFTVNNLNLYLYTEQNLSVSTGIVEKVMKGGGISIPFPYPFIQRQAVASGSISVTQQLTRGFGSKLLVVGVGIFNPTETSGTAQDHSISGLASANAGAGQYTLFAYNTLLDNIPILTNSNIVAINTAATQQNGEYWTYNKAHLKGSAIQSLNAYNNDFVHIDNFCSDPLSYIDWVVRDGLDLDAMHQYSFVVYGTATNAVNNNVYIAFICQKTLNLTPAGVQVS
jgi:hypothetical protein